jgi:hypothetical protein
MPRVVSTFVRYGLTRVCLQRTSCPTQICSAYCDFWSETEFSVLALSGFRWPPSRSSVLVRSWFSILARSLVPQLAPRSAKAQVEFLAHELCVRAVSSSVLSPAPHISSFALAKFCLLVISSWIRALGCAACFSSSFLATRSSPGLVFPLPDPHVHSGFLLEARCLYQGFSFPCAQDLIFLLPWSPFGEPPHRWKLVRSATSVFDKLVISDFLRMIVGGSRSCS